MASGSAARDAATCCDIIRRLYKISCKVTSATGALALSNRRIYAGRALARRQLA
jgi:hypothetical protein